MGMQAFSKKEALGFGWKTMKENLFFFIILFIVLFLLYIIPDILADMVTARFLLLGIMMHVAHMVLLWIIFMGVIKISLKFCDGQKPKIDDIFSCAHLFFKYLIASIFYNLIIFAGFILLIIPGIIWSLKYWFYDYFIVDKELGPMQSLKASAMITKGAKWQFFVFSCLLVLINLAGLLCFVVGLFATIPTSLVAAAHVYRQLLARTEGTEEVVEQPLSRESYS